MLIYVYICVFWYTICTILLFRTNSDGSRPGSTAGRRAQIPAGPGCPPGLGPPHRATRPGPPPGPGPLPGPGSLPGPGPRWAWSLLVPGF